VKGTRPALDKWRPMKGTPIGTPDRILLHMRVTIRPHKTPGVITAVPVKIGEDYGVRFEDGSERPVSFWLIDPVRGSPSA